MKKSKKLMILGLSAATAAVAATGAVSSFAWFATNATVTATGMKVKIQSSATLLIDTANATATNGMLKNGASTKAASTAGDDTVALNPASTADGTNWYTAKAAEASASTAKTGTYEKVKDADLNKYRLASTFYLQTFDSTKSTTAGSYDAVSPASKIVIDSITVKTYSVDDALNPSFRVLTVVGDKKVICAPTTTVERTNQGVSGIDTDTKAAQYTALTFSKPSALDSGKATLDSNNVVVETANYNEIYEADIYLYFDGEDAACKSDNIPSADKLKDYEVTVSFTITNK